MDLDIESAVYIDINEKHEIRRSLGQTPASSLRGRRPQGQPHESIPPAESSLTSSLISHRSSEGYFHRSPLPPQSLPGGLEIFREGEHHPNITPPPSVSSSGSSDIQRPGRQAIGSTPPPEACSSVPDCLRTTQLRRIQTGTIFDAELEQILQLPFKERLLQVSVDDLAYRGSEDGDSPLVLNFATLYRMRLHKLRSKLAKQVLEIRYHNALATGWEATLKEYVQAWRDWDYVNECAKRKIDPFLLKSSNCLDAAILREHLAGIRLSMAPDDSALLRQYEKDSSFPGPKDIKEPEIVGGLRNRVNKETQFRAFNKRLAMAALGWAFIVGPMLLMVLSDTKVTALCTSSVCVFAFGVLMARILERPFDVMSATAAYAAVLVVFVGSNIAPGA